MTDSDFHELAGRIEGIGRTLLHLIAILEDQNSISGKHFTDRLRDTAESLHFDRPHLEATRQTLLETANALDDARIYRQTRVPSWENRSDLPEE